VMGAALLGGALLGGSLLGADDCAGGLLGVTVSSTSVVWGAAVTVRIRVFVPPPTVVGRSTCAWVSVLVTWLRAETVDTWIAGRVAVPGVAVPPTIGSQETPMVLPPSCSMTVG
jgi:hypothetical protein